MAQIAYADPAAQPPGDLGPSPTAPTSPADRDAERRARTAAAVPLVISAGVQSVFFVQYWLPEASHAPGREWWLTQLAPLASAALTSRGEPLVPAQSAWGLPGAVLLLCAVALLGLSRGRHWMTRPAMVLPAAVGTLTAAVVLTLMLLDGQGVALGALLTIGWAVAAAYAALQGLLGRIGPAPAKTLASGLLGLLAYALLGAAPTAVGRCLFAPNLRDAAAGLQSDEGGLRLSALLSVVTVPLYLSGLLVGVLVWGCYQLWPLRRNRRTATGGALLAALLLLIGVVSWPTTTLAERRVTRLTLSSPASEATFRCGWRALRVPDPTDRPARTLVLGGLGCTRATVYDGYRQLARWTLDGSLSPVQASTPEGDRIQAEPIAAQYDDVLLLVGSTRLDKQADRVTSVRVSDGATLWSFRCARGRDFRIRFAGVPTGDDPALGQITRTETAPTVVLRCGSAAALSADPVRGVSR